MPVPSFFLLFHDNFLQVSLLEETERQTAPPDISSMEQLDQIVSYAEKSEASALYLKFAWIPSKDELKSGYQKLPKNYKKKYAKVIFKTLLLLLL